MVKVEVEYCGGCGYGPRYEELARQIKLALPEAETVGIVGRTASFEVTINGKMVFSKLEVGAFPDFEEVIEVAKKADQNEAVEEVKGTQPNCTIL